MKNKLSVIVITKNEEKNIEDCLKSLRDWVDEIIIIDSFSTDKTKVLAKKFGVKIFECKADDFAERRQMGLVKANNQWLLYVDADERVSEKLKKEIIGKIRLPYNFVAFMIPRLNIFFGQPMKYEGWYPDYQTRLFKKEKLKHWFGRIHESVKVDGEVGILKNNMIHLSHLSITKGFEKSVKWTQIEAELMFQAHHPSITLFHFIKTTFMEFFERVFLKKGIKEGNIGWLEGIIQAFNKFLIYSQLWEKQQKFCH